MQHLKFEAAHHKLVMHYTAHADSHSASAGGTEQTVQTPPIQQSGEQKQSEQSQAVKDPIRSVKRARLQTPVWHRSIAEHPHNDKLEIFIPSLAHLPASFHPSHIFRNSSKSNSIPLFYYTATLSAATLLSEHFLSLCRSAQAKTYNSTTNCSTQLLARSLHTPLDRANTFSLTNTSWTFSLDKSSYEEFGLLGRLSDFTIRHHTHDALYLVSVDISGAHKFASGKKQYERLKWCLERCYDMQCALVYVKDGTCTELDFLSGVPHQRIDLTPSLYTFARSLPVPATFQQLEQATSDATVDNATEPTQRSVKRQRTLTAADTSLHIAVEKETLLQELYEWIGAVSCRLESCLYDINLESGTNPFRTVPLCPHTTFTAATDSSTEQKTSEEQVVSDNEPFTPPTGPFTLTWHGMLASQHVIQAVQWARDLVQQCAAGCDCTPFIAVSYNGARDVAYSWRSKEHFVDDHGAAENNGTVVVNRTHYVNYMAINHMDRAH